MVKSIFTGALLNFWLFIAFSCGIILGKFFPIFLLFFIPTILSLSLSYFFYIKNKFSLSDAFIVLLFLFLGALWQIPYSLYRIDTQLGKVHFTLQVISLPQEHGEKNTFLAQLKETNGIYFGRKVKVIDYTKKMEYLGTYQGQGRLNRQIYRRSDFYFLWIKSNAQLKTLPQGIMDKVNRKTVYYILDVFKKNISDEGYRFLSSVFLGRRELFKEGSKIFTDAGIAHLLAISGSNIALCAFVFFFILKLFNIKFKPRLVISLFFILIYTLITGANLPTLRATLMYAIFAAAFFFKRKVNLLNSLGLAGLCSLLLSPASIFDVGFQLSFVSVFALIFGFRLFPVRALRSKLLTYVIYTFFSSLFVTVLITPLVSYYFGRVYILPIIYNVVMIPFFSIILIINFILLVLSPLGFIAKSTGAILSFLIHLFDIIALSLGSIRFSFVEYTFSLPMIFFYYLIVAIIFTLKLRGLQKV